jgi:ribosomal protein S27E
MRFVPADIILLRTRENVKCLACGQELLTALTGLDVKAEFTSDLHQGD